MERQSLNSGWKMRQVGWQDFIPAVVPGSVYGDLLAAGKMEDPYYKDNEMKALALMDYDYEYVMSFEPSKEILASDRAVLRFNGVDTLADIYLNDVLLDCVDNMHRTWDYEVLDMIKEGANSIRIVLHSPTKFIKEAYEKDPADGSEDAMQGFPLLRKAHCMFGWDWGPRLPDAGIWRSVELLGINTAALDSVYITQHHENGKVELEFEVELDCTDPFCVAQDCSDKDACGLNYVVTITDPNGASSKYDGSPEKIMIEKPELWWPNGYGKQALYTVKVELFKDGTVLDTWEKRIGLRTVRLAREKDQWGESFAHEVNGVKIFAMGEDYIPEDNILPRVNKERTYNLLMQCKEANFNTIRVWGGGYYPHDDFYDACDELGLLVWQDFMFACAVYNLTDDFEENITAEVIDNVKRIRHHASLGLWCGNNEMEQFVQMAGMGIEMRGIFNEYGMLGGFMHGGWMNNLGQKSDYVKMYEYIIPKLLKEYDPNTDYWPSSPSSGGAFDNPSDPNRGDCHYWEVWHGNKPFTAYREHFFRYLSEFGFQSFPAVKTIETFAEEEDKNIFSYVMEKHQRNGSANGKIMNYMSATYLYPTNFDILVYASQLLQADGIRYGVEHFRRNRGRCMGAVVWQLNDCWPVASWSSIDYEGRWKAVHYLAKRFFAPVLVSCEEEGVMSQNTNVNMENPHYTKSVHFNVSNETMAPVKVKLVWTLRSADGTVKKTCEEHFDVPALTAQYKDVVELPEADLYGDYVSWDAYYEDGAFISHGSVTFSLPKHFKFVDPQLSARVEGDEIVVTSKAYAKNVEIQNEDERLKLSDNYFDMDPGEVRVKILEGDPSKLRLRSVYDIR